MTLLDAYALVALAADEAAAAEVERLLRAGRCRALAFNLAEAADVCARVHGLADADVRDAIEPLLLSETVALAESGAREAWLAAELRGRHYDRRTSPLSLADCFLLAHALLEDEALATSDPDLARTARLEGAEVIPLPDREGRSP